MRRLIEPAIVVRVKNDPGGIGVAPLHRYHDPVGVRHLLGSDDLDRHLTRLCPIELDEEDSLPATKVKSPGQNGDAFTRAQHEMLAMRVRVGALVLLHVY